MCVGSCSVYAFYDKRREIFISCMMHYKQFPLVGLQWVPKPNTCFSDKPIAHMGFIPIEEHFHILLQLSMIDRGLFVIWLAKEIDFFSAFSI
uniref:Uncharacterized protein n=1 Tax=Romanomermis culicivorax TaxID=13658 RepID=A0A915JRW3_ROMCU